MNVLVIFNCSGYSANISLFSGIHHKSRKNVMYYGERNWGQPLCDIFTIHVK